MSKENPNELEKFQTAVLTSAVDAVAKEMPPEKMRSLAEFFITSAMEKLKGDGYGTITHFVKEQMEATLKEYLKTHDVRVLIQAAVEEGVQDALKELPPAVRGKVVQKAVEAVASVITAEKSRY